VKDIEHDNSTIFIASEFFEQIKSQLLASSSIAYERVKAVPVRLLKSMALENDIDAIGLTILNTIRNSLEATSVNYHLDAGTLLGLFRDGALIPWDDDLDIAVNAADLEQVIELMPSILERLQAATQEKWQATTHKSNHAFGNVNKGAIRSFKLHAVNGKNVPSLDLFVKYVKNDHSDYCLASRGIRMPARFMLSTWELEIAGQTWRVPKDTEGYLAIHYGKNWQVPNPDWCLQDLDNAKVFDV